VLLARHLGVPHIATGDLLRAAVRDRTELGREAQAYLDRGELVPDGLVVAMIREQLEKVGKEGVVLDGFPRNLKQAEALDAILDVELAILIDIPREEVVRRLSARRVCGRCGRTYNLISQPPQREGLCDACGGALTRRSDDAPEVVAKRYEVQYNCEVKPLIESYRKRGILIRVDGEGTIEEVFERILEAIRSVGNDSA